MLVSTGVASLGAVVGCLRLRWGGFLCAHRSMRMVEWGGGFSVASHARFARVVSLGKRVEDLLEHVDG